MYNVNARCRDTMIGIMIHVETWTLKKLCSSRKKIKYADEELLLDSSDDEYTFNTKESEGCKLIDVKYLSRAVSNAHVCEKGENFFEVCRSLFSIMT